jgi:hypothetical protein
VLMTNDILIILDECLERIRKGESIEQCLADYPDTRLQLESLLKTYQKVAGIRRVYPSSKFKQTAYTRLMSRIQAEQSLSKKSVKNKFNFNAFRRSLAFKTLVPVTLVVILVLVAVTFLPIFSLTRISADRIILSILSGSADVKTAASKDWLAGTDGMKLEVGSRVRTPSDSFALLTFFDSSTIKLEPGAEVLVSNSEYVDQRSTFIKLEQQSGKTWSYVAAGSEEKTQYSIHTPFGDALAEGTAFSTEVDNSSKTRFAVAEGTIQVTEGNREIRVEADNQIEVKNQVVPSVPLPVPPSENELIIYTSLTGIGSVCDPNGASTGSFPDGLAFNQITNSISSISPSGQQILVEEPVSGEYLLTVRKTSSGDIPVNIQAKRNGEVIYQFTQTLQNTNREGWIIRVKLDTANRTAVSASVLSIVPLIDNAPETVIETDLAKKRATPISTVGAQDKGTTAPLVSATIPPETGVIIKTSTITQTGQGKATSSTPTETPATTTVNTTTKTPEPSETKTDNSTTVIPPVADKTPPEVITTRPLKDSEKVNVSKTVTAIFSEDMDIASLNENTFVLRKGSTTVSASVSYNSTTRTAVLKQDSDLEPDTAYTATITNRVADLAGNHLAASYSWGFTTGSSGTVIADKVPPKITSVSPANNDGNLPVNITIEVVFDEVLNRETVIKPNNFSLICNGSVVDFEVEYDADSKTATITPQASLQFGATCTATITTGVTDLAGNHLAGDYIWSFSTGLPSQVVILKAEAPKTISEGSTLDVKVNISQVTNLSAFEFDLSYDKTIIQFAGDETGVTQGKLGASELEYSSLSWSFVQGNEDKLRILGSINGTSASGAGYVIEVHFNVVGSAGQTSYLTLSKIKQRTHTFDYLFDDKGNTIATEVVGNTVTVSP